MGEARHRETEIEADRREVSGERPDCGSALRSQPAKTMNRLTKVRPDAVLANQSAELQAAIYKMTLPGPGNRSYDQILEHLASECGIRLGRSPLRRWRERYHLRLREEQAEAAVRLAVEARA